MKIIFLQQKYRLKFSSSTVSMVLFPLGFFLFLVQEASFAQSPVPSPCFSQKGFQALSMRKNLFKPLETTEIIRRQNIDLHLYPSENTPFSESILNKVITAYNMATPSANFIPVDLRAYRSVLFGDFIISNLPNKHLKPEFLKKRTQFGQRFFALFNANSEGVKLLWGERVNPPPKISLLEPLKDRKDLMSSEIVFNLSQIPPSTKLVQENGRLKTGEKQLASYKVSGNLKLSGDRKIRKPISFLIEYTPVNPILGTGGVQLDLRQVLKTIFGIPQQARWQIPLYSLKGSGIHNGKYTEGILDFVFNKDLQQAVFQEFKGKTKCYYNENKPF